MVSKTQEQWAGSGLGAAVALTTYGIQMAGGRWGWAIQSAGQDLALAGLEMTLPWLASLLCATMAGWLGIRARQARDLRRTFQGLASAVLAVLPILSLVFAVQANSH